MLGYLGNSYRECKCSCGVIKSVYSKSLRNGISKSCGHSSKQVVSLEEKQFGEIYVLSHHEYKNRRHYWKCKCSCGTEFYTDTYSLTSGRCKSCGHTRLSKIQGNKYGELEVIEYYKGKKWKCRCSCGKYIYATKYELEHNLITTYRDPIHHTSISVEAAFGHLIVINYLGNSTWRCRCSCGNIIKAKTKELNSGDTVSCGCKSKNKVIEITGMQFGEWSVIEYSGNRKWKCRCSCGTVRDVSTQALISHKSKSCGCKKLRK